MKQKIMLALLCAALLSALIAAPGLAAAPKQAYEEAQDLLNQGLYAEALAQFEKLGVYEDAAKFAQYTKALMAGDQGQYAAAVANLRVLEDFKDAKLLGIYYAAREKEEAQEFDQAVRLYEQISFFRDSQAHLDAIPDLILDRDYRAMLDRIYEMTDNMRLMNEWHGMHLDTAKDYTAKDWRALFVQIEDILNRRYTDDAARLQARAYADVNAMIDDGVLDGAWYLLYGLERSGYNAADCSRALDRVYYALALELESRGFYYRAMEKLNAIVDQESYPDITALNQRFAYQFACQLEESGNLANAFSYYTLLSEYEDCPERIARIENQYSTARTLKEAGDLDAALSAFEVLKNFRNAAQEALDCRYLKAERTAAQGKYEEAVDAFIALVGYHDNALKRSWQLRYQYLNAGKIAAGYNHIVATRADGTLVTAGSNRSGQAKVEAWQDIVAIDAGDAFTIGLKKDGTVVVTENQQSALDTSAWTNVVQIAAGNSHIAALRSDGTVVAAGSNRNGCCQVSDWRDVIFVAAGDKHTLGVTKDGQLLIAGSVHGDKKWMTNWRGVRSAAIGGYHDLALLADGTVKATGASGLAAFGDANDWQDIRAIEAGDIYSVGLRRDGTVALLKSAYNHDYDVSAWQHVVAISAHYELVMGLQENGRVLLTGRGGRGWDSSQADISGWTDVGNSLTLE